MKLTTKLKYGILGTLGLGMSATSLMSKTNSSQNENTSQKPNILFILLDDLGKEWISSCGAGDIKTPNVDKLAETGVQFKNVYSMPQCTPSRVTLLTGQYPCRHGWVNHFDVPRWGHGANYDSNKNPSFAKDLQKAGYKTCIAGKWQLNDFRLQPTVLNDHGFTDYCMWTGGESKNMKASQERYWDPYIHTKSGSKTYKGKFGEDIFSDFIIDFMTKHRKKPMMMYYPMCLPHAPFVSTPLEPNATTKMEKHKAMVRYVDHIVGKLVKALEDLKLRKNTIIVFTTDNGTTKAITGTLNGRSVRGGKTLISENGINAPFIVNCPGMIPSGIVSDELIDFTDIHPTFCELANIKADSKFKYDGKSLVNAFLGKKYFSEKKWIMGMGSHPAVIENGRVANACKFRDRAIRDKKFKVYVEKDRTISQLYDIQIDKTETNNLINSSRSEVKSALKRFKKILSSLPKQDSSPKYKKLGKSIYDIPAEELKIKSDKASSRKNRD